jgi:hypothetical protein
MKSILFSICVVLGLSTLVRAEEEMAADTSVQAEEGEAAFAPVTIEEKAAPGTPDALIQELYSTTGDDAFYPVSHPEVAAKFLTPALIKLLTVDEKRSAAAEEPGSSFTDASTIYYSQDGEKVKKFATKSEIAGDTAVVKASFEMFGERVVITYKCAKEAAGWRIADVSYEDGNSVLKMLSESQG